MSNQITGNIGLYYVCYRLSKLGWNALPTSRNARGIDIVAYNDNDECRLVQVKTVTTRNAVPLGKSLENVRGDFWVIVVLGDAMPVSFVLLPAEVRELATTDKGGAQASWLSHKDFFHSDAFRDRWDRFK